MNGKEMRRLNDDHQRVALARVTAAWRILTKPLTYTIETALDRLTRLLTH